MKVIYQTPIARLIKGQTQDNLKNKILKLLKLIKNRLKFYQVIFLSHNLKNHFFLSNKIRIQMKHFIKQIKIMNKFNKFRIKLIPQKIIKTELILLTIEDWSPRMKIK